MPSDDLKCEAGDSLAALPEVLAAGRPSQLPNRTISRPNDGCQGALPCAGSSPAQPTTQQPQRQPATVSTRWLQLRGPVLQVLQAVSSTQLTPCCSGLGLQYAQPRQLTAPSLSLPSTLIAGRDLHHGNSTQLARWNRIKTTATRRMPGVPMAAGPPKQRLRLKLRLRPIPTHTPIHPRISSHASRRDVEGTPSGGSPHASSPATACR